MVMQVEVIHILQDGSVLKADCEVGPGTTVAQAAEASTVWQQITPESIAGVGIHGQKVEWTTRVRTGDRIELYRALRCDPKQMRRQRL